MLYVIAKIFDAIRIVNRSALVNGVEGAQTVLDNHERDLMPAVELFERIAQAIWINLPANRSP